MRRPTAASKGIAYRWRVVSRRKVFRDTPMTTQGIAAIATRSVGIVIGIALTNAHVVGNSRTVGVGLADGRTLNGQVLGRDPSHKMWRLATHSDSSAPLHPESSPPSVGILGVGPPVRLSH